VANREPGDPAGQSYTSPAPLEKPDALTGISSQAPHPQASQAPPKTRASALWTALAVGMVLLVAIVVFILQNLKDVKVTFFAVHWRMPLALDLLLAAALGGAVVFLAGAVRMLQLRLHGRRRRAGPTGSVPGRR
jgi:uncharacterized integral membrane protein